jgi:glucose/arabinose dehydrogenase
MSSVLDLVFYDGEQFPAEYRGDAFVALKGSWNRSEPTGYKVVRVRFKDGRPDGSYCAGSNERRVAADCRRHWWDGLAGVLHRIKGTGIG